MANTQQMYGAGSPFAPLAYLLVEATDAALEGLRTLAINPIATLAQYQARAEQRRRLAEMEDHLLSDIGLNRAEADKEAKKPIWVA